MDNYTQEKMLENLNTIMYTVSKTEEIQSNEDLRFIQQLELASYRLHNITENLIKSYLQKK